MAIDKAILGRAVKQVRQARGLTQVELAAAAGLAKGGKSIALIEQGKRFVSVDTLNLLANALDIPSACLAILGSRTIGKNKPATEFMEGLRHLISTVIVAQSHLSGADASNAPKRDNRASQTRQLRRATRLLNDAARPRSPQKQRAKSTARIAV